METKNWQAEVKKQRANVEALYAKEMGAAIADLPPRRSTEQVFTRALLFVSAVLCVGAAIAGLTFATWVAFGSFVLSGLLWVTEE